MDRGDPSSGAAGSLAGSAVAAAAIHIPTVGHITNTAGILGGGGIAGVGATGTINTPTATSAGWWTPTSTIVTTPANTDVMNQLCRVCGEPAAGFHFGAFTCEGCKSFFGRTYNNLGSISECKNGGACVINKKNRTACKACRLRKCLMVGMSKSGSRYGRRSNWFKIHCLLQEQSHQAQSRYKEHTKSSFEKVLNSLDAANNNSSNNGNNPMSALPTSVAGNNTYAGRLPKLDDPRLRPQELVALRTQQDSPRSQQVTGPTDLMGGNPDLLRPEAPRFPIWRGPPFFHPALSHMHLINSPFFPFQQRFVMPYVNQLGTAPIPVTSLTSSSSSSESISPRSTPSPKPDVDQDDDSRRTRRIDESVDEVGTIQQQPAEFSGDKGLAFLRSLGPEQDVPMDLSRRTASMIAMIRDDETDLTTSSADEMTEDRDEEVARRGEDTGIMQTDTGPPLDLTTKT